MFLIENEEKSFERYFETSPDIIYVKKKIIFRRRKLTFIRRHFGLFILAFLTALRSFLQ